MTNFQTLVPKKPIQSFKEISEAGLITQGMLFKLYRTGQIEVIKIGNRNNVSRDERLRYLDDDRIEKISKRIAIPNAYI